MERAYTDFLTPDSTFLIGAGSVLSLDGSNFFYNRSGNRVLADARAIHQDFVMIGQDILDVVQSMERERKKQLDLAL